MSSLLLGGKVLANTIVFEKEFLEMLEQFKGKKGALIPVLQETQDLFGYLPEDAMKEIASTLKIPFSEVYGVATFYSQFKLKPRGKNIIRVCSGTACHVRGGPKILDVIEEELNIKSGETTSDLCFTIERVACLGACGLAPVMMVNDETYGRLTKDKITDILKDFK